MGIIIFDTFCQHRRDYWRNIVRSESARIGCNPNIQPCNYNSDQLIDHMRIANIGQIDNKHLFILHIHDLSFNTFKNFCNLILLNNNYYAVLYSGNGNWYPYDDNIRIQKIIRAYPRSAQPPRCISLEVATTFIYNFLKI